MESPAPTKSAAPTTHSAPTAPTPTTPTKSISPTTPAVSASTAPAKPAAPTRVLVVAHKTAATEALIEAVRTRAARGPCTFVLLVPNATHGMHKVVDPEDQAASEARRVLARALPALSEAAGAPVEGIVGDPDPMAAVQDAINLRGFDEAIISTLSPRISRWLRLDLPSKVAGMGLPVTTVTPKESASAHAA